MIDGVEVEVVWYYNGKEVTDDPAYAQAKTGYTYAVKNMQPTEGSDVSFAESVTVKKDVVVDGKVEVVEKPVAVKPGESIDVGVDGTPSIGTGDDTTEGNLTVNFSGAPAGTIVTVNLDGNKATQVKSGEKVTAVTGKDLTLNITVPRGYKVESVTGAEKAATKDGGRDLYTISAISDKAAVVNITFAEREVYTLTLSGDQLVKTGNDAGKIYKLTAQGENDEGILFPTGVPAGETPNASGKYVRTFKVYEGETVTVQAAESAITKDSVVIIDGVAVNMKQAVGSGARATATTPNMLTFTMPGKNFSLYMNKADELSANAQSDPEKDNMVAVYVSEGLTFKSDKETKVVNGVDYVPAGAVLTVSGGKWTAFTGNDAKTAIKVSSVDDIKADGTTYTVKETVYLKPVVAFSANNVNMYDQATNGTQINTAGVVGVVKGTKVYMNVTTGSAVLAWAIEAGKTAADAPIVGNTELVKTGTARIAYTMDKDVVLAGAVKVEVGSGVAATAEKAGSQSAAPVAITASAPYVAAGSTVAAKASGTAVQGTAVVGMNAKEAFTDQKFESMANVSEDLVLTVAPMVTFRFQSSALWGFTQEAQTGKFFENATKLEKSYYVRPGTWIKTTAEGSAYTPEVTDAKGETVNVITNEKEPNTVVFQVGSEPLTVTNTNVKLPQITVGNYWYIYDKDSWFKAYNDGVRGLVTYKNDENETVTDLNDGTLTAEEAWEKLDGHGRSTFPWLYVEVKNDEAATVSFKSTVYKNGSVVKSHYKEPQTVSLERTGNGSNTTDWGVSSEKANGFIHWELVKSNATGVYSLDNQDVAAAVGAYTIDLTFDETGQTIKDIDVGSFDAADALKMVGIHQVEQTEMDAQRGDGTAVDAKGQAWTVGVEDGEIVLTINKAYDLTEKESQTAPTFGGYKFTNTGWGFGNDVKYAIILGFKSPIGYWDGSDGEKSHVHITCSTPQNGSAATDDGKGDAYLVYGLGENAAENKTIKVMWKGDDNNSEGREITIKVVDRVDRPNVEDNNTAG